MAERTTVPASEAEAVDLIREHAARAMPLRILGGGTRKAGRASGPATLLSTAGLSGITLFEPAEMVLSAKAGTPMAEIEAALDAKGQMLPFEPMDHRRLLGTGGEPTIGGVAAGNICGPRRFKAGGARDSLIGLRFINGAGEVIRSGGRVMKNVTGLDLVKLQAGACGTLGLLSEVTFKLLPTPETSASLVIEGLGDEAAVALLCKAAGSPFEMTGAAHLPAGAGSATARTVLRVEGFADQVTYRLERLAALCESPALRLDARDSLALWRDIRDGVVLDAAPGDAVWRVSIAPNRAPKLAARLRGARRFTHIYDWCGGLMLLATPEEGDAGAEVLRAAVAAEGGGHATLLRGSEALRARIDVFQPLTPGLERLTRAVKASIDPKGLFNPGLMYPGL
ncbi:MAG: FAD-binding protein [Hyphomicrobiaceae bacterium]|nr:FAD-binding protein [Hyphomicrobiaceae bacterium]